MMMIHYRKNIKRIVNRLIHDNIYLFENVKNFTFLRRILFFNLKRKNKFIKCPKIFYGLYD